MSNDLFDAYEVPSNIFTDDEMEPAPEEIDYSDFPTAPPEEELEPAPDIDENYAGSSIDPLAHKEEEDYVIEQRDWEEKQHEIDETIDELHSEYEDKYGKEEGNERLNEILTDFYADEDGNADASVIEKILEGTENDTEDSQDKTQDGNHAHDKQYHIERMEKAQAKIEAIDKGIYRDSFVEIEKFKESYHAYKAGATIKDDVVKFSDVLESWSKVEKTNIFETAILRGVHRLEDIIKEQKEDKDSVDKKEPEDIDKNAQEIKVEQEDKDNNPDVEMSENPEASIENDTNDTADIPETENDLEKPDEELEKDITDQPEADIELAKDDTEKPEDTEDPSGVDKGTDFENDQLDIQSDDTDNERQEDLFSKDNVELSEEVQNDEYAVENAELNEESKDVSTDDIEQEEESKASEVDAEEEKSEDISVENEEVDKGPFSDGVEDEDEDDEDSSTDTTSSNAEKDDAESDPIEDDIEQDVISDIESSADTAMDKNDAKSNDDEDEKSSAHIDIEEYDENKQDKGDTDFFEDMQYPGFENDIDTINEIIHDGADIDKDEISDLSEAFNNMADYHDIPLDEVMEQFRGLIEDAGIDADQLYDQILDMTEIDVDMTETVPHIDIGDSTYAFDTENGVYDMREGQFVDALDDFDVVSDIVDSVHDDIEASCNTRFDDYVNDIEADIPDVEMPNNDIDISDVDNLEDVEIGEQGIDVESTQTATDAMSDIAAEESMEIEDIIAALL